MKIPMVNKMCIEEMEGKTLKLAEVSKDTVYTANIDFLDGDLEGSVLYKKGYFDREGNWRHIGGLADCKKQSFASWAKACVYATRGGCDV